MGSNQTSGMLVRTKVAIGVGIAVPTVVLTLSVIAWWVWRQRQPQHKYIDTEAAGTFRVIRVRQWTGLGENLIPRATTQGSVDTFSAARDTAVEVPRRDSNSPPPYSSLPEVVGHPLVVEQRERISTFQPVWTTPDGAGQKDEASPNRILAIDKRSLLQDLTDPRGKHNVYSSSDKADKQQVGHHAFTLPLQTREMIEAF